MARKLNRKTADRLALLRNLAADVIIHERIETTEAKAKELRSSVERMITLGKRGDLNARREAARFLYNKRIQDGELVATNKQQSKDEREDTETTLNKLFGELAERYEERQGGYTRVLKLGPRRGDGTNMAIIELVD